MTNPLPKLHPLDIAVYYQFDTAFSYWPSIEFYLRKAGDAIHWHNQKWWTDLQTGEPIERNVPELLCLVHSEISEALEAHRKNLMDDKLPDRLGIEVEIADAIIRLLDLGAGLKLDVPGAVADKVRFNTTRQDHTREARLAENGKRY